MRNDIGLGRTDEEILIDELSDEVLERAAGGEWQPKPDAFPTVWSYIAATCCQY